MKIKVKTFKGTMAFEYKVKTFAEAKKKLREHLRKAGWIEVNELTSISQFKVLPESTEKT